MVASNLAFPGCSACAREPTAHSRRHLFPSSCPRSPLFPSHRSLQSPAAQHSSRYARRPHDSSLRLQLLLPARLILSTRDLPALSPSYRSSGLCLPACPTALRRRTHTRDRLGSPSIRSESVDIALRLVSSAQRLLPIPWFGRLAQSFPDAPNVTSPHLTSRLSPRLTAAHTRARTLLSPSIAVERRAAPLLVPVPLLVHRSLALLQPPALPTHAPARSTLRHPQASTWPSLGP